MAEKEERIAIVKSPCCIHNKKTIFKNDMTRADAVERMAKAICETGIGCHTCRRENNKEECKKFIKGNLYLLYAEAALDAVLGGKK